MFPAVAGFITGVIGWGFVIYNARPGRWIPDEAALCRERTRAAAGAPRGGRRRTSRRARPGCGRAPGRPGPAPAPIRRPRAPPPEPLRRPRRRPPPLLRLALRPDPRRATPTKRA